MPLPFNSYIIDAVFKLSQEHLQLGTLKLSVKHTMHHICVVGPCLFSDIKKEYN